MSAKKNKRGQNRKLKMDKVNHQMRQDQENDLRNVNVRRGIMNNVDHQK
jgi:hypothetical protein